MHRSLNDSSYKLKAPDLYDMRNWGLFRKAVKPIRGSVIWLGSKESAYSGIYLGNDKIACINKAGIIETLSRQQIVEKTGGLDDEINIFVSCANGIAVGLQQAAELAEQRLLQQSAAVSFAGNGHRFCAGCLLNDFEAGNSVLSLEQLATICGTEINACEWGIWPSENI